MEIDWDALPQAEAKAHLRAGLAWRDKFIRELQSIGAPLPEPQPEKRKPGRPSNEERELTARQQQLAEAEAAS